MLTGFDVGLALMYTPHPSLVPLEMASAGMIVVTNSFENKTAGGAARDLREPDRRRAEPAGRHRCARARRWPRRDDHERAGRGAAVRWPTDWQDSFNDEVVDRIVAFLDAELRPRDAGAGLRPGLADVAAASRRRSRACWSGCEPRLAIEIGTAEGACARRLAGRGRGAARLRPRIRRRWSCPTTSSSTSATRTSCCRRSSPSWPRQGRNVDFALVDGDHSRRPACAATSRTCSTRRRSGGSVIVIHDIANERVRARRRRGSLRRLAEGHLRPPRLDPGPAVPRARARARALVRARPRRRRRLALGLRERRGLRAALLPGRAAAGRRPRGAAGARRAGGPSTAPASPTSSRTCAGSSTSPASSSRPTSGTSWQRVLALAELAGDGAAAGGQAAAFRSGRGRRRDERSVAMRIALVSAELYPLGGGGIGQFASAAARLLAEAAEVTVLTSSVHRPEYERLRAARDPRLPPPGGAGRVRRGARPRRRRGSYFSVDAPLQRPRLRAAARALPRPAARPGRVRRLPRRGLRDRAGGGGLDPFLRETAGLRARPHLGGDRARSSTGSSRATSRPGRPSRSSGSRCARPTGCSGQGGDVLGTYRRFYGADRDSAPALTAHPLPLPRPQPPTPTPTAASSRASRCGCSTSAAWSAARGSPTCCAPPSGLDRDDFRLTLVGADTATAPLGVSMRDQLQLAAADDERIEIRDAVPRERAGRAGPRPRRRSSCPRSGSAGPTRRWRRCT